MASIFGSIGVETPKFALLNKFGSVEIRRYAPHIKASVPCPMAQSRAFDNANISTSFRMLAGCKLDFLC